MAIFLVDPNKLTITVHREKSCPALPDEQRQPCECSQPGSPGKPTCFCETHLDLAIVSQMLEGRFSLLLLCETCFPSSKKAMTLDDWQADLDIYFVTKKTI